MPENPIQVSRDGVVLGVMTESEALELLRIGLLRPDDLCSRDGLTPCKSLGELQVPRQPPPGKTTWFGQATRSLSAARTAVAHTTGEWADKAKSLAGVTRTGTANATDRLLSGFIPQIRKIVSDLARTKPFQKLHSGVNDDALMLKVFGAGYDCLPRPVCRFVSEQQFVAFCMKHRAQLLQRENTEPGNPR